MLTIPNNETIEQWLNQLSINSYYCQECCAFHLSHIRQLDNVFDAKIELIDDVLLFSIISEVKVSAIPTLLNELGQIHQNSFFVKAYFDLQENEVPKLVFSHAIHCLEGLSFNQFNLFISSVESEALQIIEELSQYGLLLSGDNNTVLDQRNTYH